MMVLAPVRAGMRLAMTGAHALETLGRARMGGGLPEDHASARRFCRLATELAMLHGLRTEVSGRLPWGPALLVANHLSYLDPLVIGMLGPCLPIAKAEVGGWPLLGAAARSLGVMFVQRDRVASGVRVLHRVARALAVGVSVLNFPEGTTSDGAELRPFRRGSFGVAARLGIPIVPIALRYDRPDLCWVGDDLFLPHYLRTAARPRATAFLALGAPLVPARFGGVEGLTRAAHDAVRRLYAGIRA